MLKPAITPINTHTHTPNMHGSDCKYKHYVDFIYTAAERGGGVTCSGRKEDPKHCEEIFTRRVIWHRVAAQQPGRVSDEAVV